MAYVIEKGKKFIPADSGCFQYMGRIDFDDPARPVLVWVASTVDVIFTGTSVAAVLKNIDLQEHAYFGAFVDGVQQSFEMKHGREDELYVLAENLEPGEHTLRLMKRLAAAHYVEFAGIVVDEDAEVRNPEHQYDLKLEVFGDSVSAGEVTEALFYEGKQDPPHHSQYDNCHFSYAMSLARKLNAELHDTAQGGIALFDGTGWFCSDQLTGMLSCYDKLEYSPYLPKKDWDFSKWQPDVVIIAIGQNDANPEPERIKTTEYRRKWKDAYIGFLNDLRGKYPGTKFVLMLTVLRHDPTWDDALEEICTEVDSPDVTHFMFRRNGDATDGHPRATEQEEMAGELYNYFMEEVLK